MITLFKGFKEESHLNNYRKGIIRLASLTHYRHLDEEEHNKVGDQFEGGNHIDASIVLIDCYSSKPLTNLYKHTLEIKDPNALKENILRGFNNCNVERVKAGLEEVTYYNLIT